ncbi:L-histidine N(alpha)-methyltransferase [Gymnodinialimonas sp. 2305UL16-5]|uniref:L-histidine N(alpha)-methyltransferase n=1 Tax=Gymnodinialimonas mytili TaxID=3126503 RepID=UPI0030ABE2F3
MDGNPRYLDPTATALLDDALHGLTRPEKVLSPKWLYDQRGSALFEQITTLPEYYLTRTEAGILRANSDLLAGLVPEDGALVELGSGASVKTRILLDAGGHFGAYVPVDISEGFLHDTADGLRQRYPDLAIHPKVGDFTGPLTLPHAVADLPKIGFFPGSTIGNLAPDAARDLLAHARKWPAMEGFILGADLVKSADTLVAAYDDAQAVTAAFISNILVRLNSELGADFDLDHFRYEALWNDRLARIDMRLISARRQIVHLQGHEIAFAKDEPIHVSAARKFTDQSLSALVGAAGWSVNTVLTDPDGLFAIAVLRPN